ncbi:gliding motility protein GldN [candidate division KSB1 bacterium]
MKKLLLTLSLITFLSCLGITTYAQVFDSPPRDGVYDKIHSENRKPIPYTNLREADASWVKRMWRVIDMREKINHPFYYPEVPHEGWRSFVTILFDGLKEGSLTAYEISHTDEFLVPLTYQRVLETLERTDTITLQRLEPPYDYYDTVIRQEFNPQDVKQIRLKEDWFFDKQRSVLDVRIIGICPVMDDYDELGNYKGPKPLFWIYFPEARPLFAKTEVFNRFNDAERRTYEDVFWKRMFGSFVIKESNVYDRRISQYKLGLDALLEADRIKEELFLFEHELWEF